MPDNLLQSKLSSDSKPKAGDVVERLKQETREQHERLETDLELLDHLLDVQRYLGLLEGFYGLYEPWERLVYPMLESALPGRAKLQFLIDDLVWLGSDTEALAICPAIQRPQSLAEALGSMYVIEGSTLGGQIIARHVQQSLGFSDARGCRFFASYGSDVGVMWRGFREVLLEQSPTQNEATIIRSAQYTFACFHDWLVKRRTGWNGAQG